MIKKGSYENREEIPNHIQINTSTKNSTKKQILFQLNRRFPKKAQTQPFRYIKLYTNLICIQLEK